MVVEAGAGANRMSGNWSLPYGVVDRLVEESEVIRGLELAIWAGRDTFGGG